MKAVTAVRGIPGILQRAFLSEYLVLLLSALYFSALAPFTPDFLTGENLRDILSNMLPLLLVAVGQTIVLIVGGIDLSVTSVIALSSVFGAHVMTADGGWLHGSPLAVPGAIATMLIVGMSVGFLNGASVAWGRMPPFIVTLTTMMFFSGFAVWFTQSEHLFNLPEPFLVLGGRLWSGLAITVAVAAVAHWVLTRSLYGRWIFATGRNLKAARLSGVPVDRVIVGAYVASGLCAAVASILYTGRLETGSPTMGREILLDVIGATVIGGTSLYGGVGKVLWTVYGVLFLTLIGNSLLLLNLSPFTIMVVKGAIILGAATLDTLRRRLLEA